MNWYDDPVVSAALAEELDWETRMHDALEMYLAATPGLVLVEHVWACPELFEGTLDGVGFLFRERRGSWRIERGGVTVAEGSTEALPGRLGADHLRFVVETLRGAW